LSFEGLQTNSATQFYFVFHGQFLIRENGEGTEGYAHFSRWRPAVNLRTKDSKDTI